LTLGTLEVKVSLRNKKATQTSKVKAKANQAEKDRGEKSFKDEKSVLNNFTA